MEKDRLGFCGGAAMFLFSLVMGGLAIASFVLGYEGWNWVSLIGGLSVCAVFAFVGIGIMATVVDCDQRGPNIWGN